MNVEVKFEENGKGKCLFAVKKLSKDTVILEEDPLVSCQFSWNASCKYKACDHCLRPLETAEENVRRLTGNLTIELPYPECCENETIKDSITACPACGVQYCSENCRVIAFDQYHNILCIQTHERNNVHPLEQLEDAWKQIHYPPETSSIFLIVRLLARILQAPNRDEAIQQILGFCHTSVNEDAGLVHKLMGDKFIGQINLLRELVINAIPNQGIEQFLSPDGFQSLWALIGTNGQGVGTSPFSRWRQNVEKLDLISEEKEKIEDVIEKIYEDMYSHTGDFLNSEGSALYRLQSSANHSCDPNAQILFQHNNYRLSLVALRDIESNEEICISYLGDCDIDRSRHSRRKMLMENYLFACDCAKCLAQIDDPAVTSEEEMSECDSES